MKNGSMVHTFTKCLGAFALALAALLVPSLTVKPSGLLEIAVPFDPAGKTDVKVYRCCGSRVDVLTDTANRDGEYIALDEEGITLHVKDFFPYAIGYKEVKEDGPPMSSALGEGLAAGTIAAAFAQEIDVSMAMAVTILWRLQGSPAAGSAVKYAGIEEGAWYTEAVRWAVSEGIVVGYSDGRLGLHDPITRERLAAILYRCAKAEGGDTSVGGDAEVPGYKDFGQVSEWAVPAVQWADGNGIVNGRGSGVLDPQGSAAGAEAAAMIMRYCFNPALCLPAGKPIAMR